MDKGEFEKRIIKHIPILDPAPPIDRLDDAANNTDADVCGAYLYLQQHAAIMMTSMIETR